MQVILDIKKSVDWYNKNYKVATIDELLNLKSKLVTLNFYLAELVADNNEYQMQWENEKKVKFAKIKNDLLKEGYQIGKADAKADDSIAEERNNYVSFKSVYDRVKILHNQTNAICDDIMQRISVLKIELKQN